MRHQWAWYSDLAYTHTLKLSANMHMHMHVRTFACHVHVCTNKNTVVYWYLAHIKAMAINNYDMDECCHTEVDDPEPRGNYP